MSISTNYDYNRYAQYSSSVSSLLVQQRINNKQGSQDKNSSQSIQLVNQLEQGTTENRFKSPLASLVESGTITSEQEKAIKDALEASRMAYQTQAGAANAPQNPLASLVESGTITEEQEAAIKGALDSAKGANRMPPPPQLTFQEDKDSDPLTDTLDSLVTAGTITKEQKESILSALEEAFQSNQAESSVASDPLAGLVESGTITEEQEAAVQGAFEEEMKTHMMPPPPPPQNDGIDSISSVLDELGENGKITTEQQETIVNALKETFQSNQTENNTESDPLAGLVESGTITEEQEAAVQNAFQSAIKAYFAQAYSYDDIFRESFDASR